jgi:hypothetical protein
MFASWTSSGSETKGPRVSDDAERRQRRQFEPPPWERDGFEALARRHAVAGQGAEEASESPAEPQPGAEPAVGVVTPVGREPKAAPVMDDRKVAAMLIELSGEEGSAKRPVVQAGKAAAIALVAIGVMMMVLAAVLALRSLSPVSQAGAGTSASVSGVETVATEAGGGAATEGGIGAAVIAVLGVFVAGFAGWMWVRANREQGS